MKVIIKSRGQGKTAECIRLSAARECPIICFDEKTAEYIKHKANHMGYTIPEPITFKQAKKRIQDSEVPTEKELIVDELQAFMEFLMEAPLFAASITKEEI